LLKQLAESWGITPPGRPFPTSCLDARRCSSRPRVARVRLPPSFAIVACDLFLRRRARSRLPIA